MQTNRTGLLPTALGRWTQRLWGASFLDFLGAQAGGVRVSTGLRCSPRSLLETVSCPGGRSPALQPKSHGATRALCSPDSMQKEGLRECGQAQEGLWRRAGGVGENMETFSCLLSLRLVWTFLDARLALSRKRPSTRVPLNPSAEGPQCD